MTVEERFREKMVMSSAMQTTSWMRLMRPRNVLNLSSPARAMPPRTAPTKPPNRTPENRAVIERPRRMIAKKEPTVDPATNPKRMPAFGPRNSHRLPRSRVMSLPTMKPIFVLKRAAYAYDSVWWKVWTVGWVVRIGHA